MPTVIAKAAPLSGAPKIMMPTLYGVATGKEMFYVVPVLGERPVTVSVSGLPEGLSFDGSRISGTTAATGDHLITVTAENGLGKVEKAITLRVDTDAILLTPLMGYTTWNACTRSVNQEYVAQVALQLKEKSLDLYGYNYINIDSGWQLEYGGEFDAVIPNPKFPDMKALCDHLHAHGFKAGIYSTPMLTAWGCPTEYASIPGCTQGEPDILETEQMEGIGLIHKEQNNVNQWEAWGFDYLKYDWKPCTPNVADRMKQALLASKRAFAFCCTIRYSNMYYKYACKHINSWRDNADSKPFWENVKRRLTTVDNWYGRTAVGHFYDLDMLEIGRMNILRGENTLTPDEQLFSYTMRAFFMSPIQISCHLDELNDWEYDLFTNDEIIDVNQDALCDYPEHLPYKNNGVDIFRRKLENGDMALAIFNSGDEIASDTIVLLEKSAIRDLWAKEDLGEKSAIEFTIEPHSAKIYRIHKI